MLIMDYLGLIDSSRKLVCTYTISFIINSYLDFLISILPLIRKELNFNFRPKALKNTKAHSTWASSSTRRKYRNSQSNTPILWERLAAAGWGEAARSALVRSYVCISPRHATTGNKHGILKRAAKAR